MALHVAAVLVAVLLSGCAARTWRVTRDVDALLLTAPARKAKPQPVVSVGQGAFLDLQPEWRIRTITPILKSGAFRLPSATRQEGLTSSIDSRGEFLGVETAFYHVRRDMRLELASVEASVEGKAEKRSKPIANLFQLPADVRHVRFVYLTRVSDADHDMAIVAARTTTEIDELTRKVKSEPAGACGSTPYCTWVPAGIAVLAQAKVNVDGADLWIAANGRIRDALPAQRTAEVFRQWKGKPVPVTGASADLLSLPVAVGDIIRTQ
jgi:hypothetical protein